MKQSVIILLSLLGVCGTLRAQEPTTPQEPVGTEAPAAPVIEEPARHPSIDFVEQLAVADTLTGARVKVAIHPSAEEAIHKYNTQTSPKESYQGYRIRIFASHNQSARTDAEAAIALFEEHYNVPVYFAYENPYFLVTCGNCLSHDEAIMLLSKVRIHFPKAFIVTCEIPAKEFDRKPQPKPEEAPVEVEGESEVTSTDNRLLTTDN